jgi:hypothetical protein
MYAVCRLGLTVRSHVRRDDLQVGHLSVLVRVLVQRPGIVPPLALAHTPILVVLVLLLRPKHPVIVLLRRLRPACRSSSVCCRSREVGHRVQSIGDILFGGVALSQSSDFRRAENERLDQLAAEDMGYCILD